MLESVMRESVMRESVMRQAIRPRNMPGGVAPGVALVTETALALALQSRLRSHRPPSVQSPKASSLSLVPAAPR